MAGRGIRGADGNAMPLHGAGAEWWRDLLPGQLVHVTYEDDGVAHERIIGWPMGTDESDYLVRSPDDDEWVERLRGDRPNSGPNGGGILPRDGSDVVQTTPRYRFREYPSRDELIAFFGRAVKRVRQGCRIP